MNRLSGLAVLVALLASSASARDCVLYVGAHPDEFINEVGVACLLSNRYDNVVVTLTHGERGRPEWGMEKTKEVRTREEGTACAALGFGLHMLDGIDGELWKWTEKTSGQLAELFRRYRPVAVFLQYPVDDHLDHVAAFTIGRLALRESGIKPQVFLMNYRSQTSGMQPDYIVDISAHIEAKKRYCRTHACQSGDYMAECYAAESAVIGKPFGMKFAEEYTVYSTPGSSKKWSCPSKTLLDEIGLRLRPGIHDVRPLFRIGLLTDTHVNNRPESCRLFRLAMERFKREGVEVVCHGGDYADSHSPDGYRECRRIMEATFGEKMPLFLYAYGGHDGNGRLDMPEGTPRNRHHAYAWSVMRKLLKIDHDWYETVDYKGYPFLIVPEGWKGPEYVEPLVKAAIAKYPGKPLFVLEHTPGADTTSESPAWGDPARTRLYSKFPQVVHLSGHTHGTPRDERMIWQGGYTEITLGGLQIWAGSLAMADRRYLGKSDDGVMVMSVYPDRLVLRRYSLLTGEEYRPDDPWTVPLPMDPKTAPYNPARRKAASQPPTWPDGATVAADWDAKGPGGYRGLAFSVPEARHREAPFLYRADVFVREATGVWKLRTLLETYGEFWIAEAEKRTGRATFFFKNGMFAAGEELKVVVTPFDFYGNAGKPLEGAFTVPAKRDGGASAVLWETDASLAGCKFEHHFWGSNRRELKPDAEGWFAVGEMADLFLPAEAIPPTDKKGTRYCLVVEIATSRKGTGQWYLQGFNARRREPLYGGFYATPGGDTEPLRYVFEFEKYDDLPLPIRLDFTYGSGGGRVKFTAMKLERLAQGN